MQHNHNNRTSFPFLRGDGEMVGLVRDFDWNTTTLGSPESWPQSLKTSVSIVLHSKAPMLLWWGDDLIQFYNDSYRESLGDDGKHPKALGQKAVDCWPEIWDIIDPLITQVKATGEATWNEEQLVPINRNGRVENIYWSFGFSPVMGESGEIDGVMIICHDITRQIEVNDAHASEFHFQNLISDATIGIVVLLGDELKVEIANEAYGNIIGFTPIEILGRPLFSILPDAETEYRTYIESVLQTGKPLFFYGHPYRPDAENQSRVVYLNLVYQPYMKKGRVAGVMILCHDVTDQILATLKIEESEQRFRSLVDSAPFPIGVYLGKEMTIALGNQAIFDIWGRNKEVLGKRYRDVFPELASTDVFEKLEQVYETGNPHYYYNKYFELNHNGKPFGFYVNTAFKPLFNAKGEVYGILSSAVDVTDLNLAIKKSEESESKFRALIEHAPVATCLFTGKDMIVEVANEMMISVWGKDETVMGKPLAEAVPELIGQPFLDILSEVFDTGIAYSDKSARADLVVDGKLQTFYFDFTYKPLFDAKGEVYGVIDMAVDVTERVIATQQIAETQRQLLESFEQSPVGIAVLSKDNLTFTMANPFYGQLVGRNVEDIIGKTLLEALPEIEGQGYVELLNGVIETGVPFVYKEAPVNIKYGDTLETIYVDLAYQPKREADGSTSGVLVVASDVTQQVISRRQVEQSEAKLRSVIANAPAGIGLFVGRDLIIEMPNQMFIDIVGKGPDIVGKPLREVMPELITEGQPFLKILDDIFTTGIMFQSDGSLVQIVQNGVMTYNYYNITYSPLFDENGEVYAILDIAIDVTDAVKAREKAEKAEASLRGAVEIAELANWSLDIKNNSFSYSPRFMDWLGFSESTKDFNDAYNSLPDEFRQSVIDEIQKAITPGTSGIYKNEHPIINRKTGQERIIQAHAQVFYDLSGKPEFLSGTAQDVTKERKQQQQLEYLVTQRTEELQLANSGLADAIDNLQRSNAELAQFAYIASHDLQEPLRKISTFAKMLENNLGEIDDRSKNYLDRINVSAERMTTLIRDILGYSQLSKENEAFRPVHLKKILVDILSDFELIIEQKKAVVTYSELPIIDAIPLQMMQLFSNLISNSLKYSKEGQAPKIEIRSSILKAGELQHYDISLTGAIYHKIEFSDNGIGFSAEHAEQIFNIFQRLHGKNEYAGTGIGLAMCRKIADNHHGSIHAVADIGKGATFVVVLPEKQSYLSNFDSV